MKTNRAVSLSHLTGLFASLALVGAVATPAAAGTITIIHSGPAPAPAPAPSPSPAPAPAPAPSPAPSGAIGATRAATLAYGNLNSTQRAAIGKFAFAVLNMYPSMGQSGMQSQINALRSVNPNIKLAQYVVLNEAPNTAASNSDLYPVVQAINGANWWVRYANGGLVAWTNAFGNYEINMTNWALTNSAGQRWPQWKANFDSTSLLHKVTGLNYIFNDNVMWQPRYDADIERHGTNQSRNDPTVESGFRSGFAAYWSYLRSYNSGLKIMGNSDNDLSYPEYKGKLEGSFNECLMGKSWSIETWGGWNQMMARYRAQIANTASPHDVIFQACGTSGANPAQARYGFASALLENGYFAYTVDGLTSPYWADEFSAPLGTPSEAPPTAPTSSGIWMRHYSNGLVLVNPSTTTTLSINIGTGYKHITGTYDRVTNNGMPEQTVSLPPRSGLVMIKQ
jgi:hypothetical protein